MTGVVSPFLNTSCHILRDFGLKEHPLSTDRMDEAQRPRMQGLPGKHPEGILHKLTVFAKGGPFQDSVTPILYIIEKGVSNILKMNPYLVSPSGLQSTRNQHSLFPSLQNLNMRNRWLPKLRHRHQCR